MYFLSLFSKRQRLNRWNIKTHVNLITAHSMYCWGYGLYNRRIVVRLPTGARDVSLLQRFRTDGPTQSLNRCVLRDISPGRGGGWGGGGERGVKLITHLDPMPRLRIKWATLPLPHMYSRRARWRSLRKKWNVRLAFGWSHESYTTQKISSKIRG